MRLALLVWIVDLHCWYFFRDCFSVLHIVRTKSDCKRSLKTVGNSPDFVWYIRKNNKALELVSFLAMHRDIRGKDKCCFETTLTNHSEHTKVKILDPTIWYFYYYKYIWIIYWYEHFYFINLKRTHLIKKN